MTQRANRWSRRGYVSNEAGSACSGQESPACRWFPTEPPRRTLDNGRKTRKQKTAKWGLGSPFPEATTKAIQGLTNVKESFTWWEVAPGPSAHTPSPWEAPAAGGASSAQAKNNLPKRKV